MKPSKQILYLSFLAGFVCASCSNNEKPKPESILTATNQIEILDGWVRTGSAGMMSAAYFTINNGTEVADTLLSIQSDASPNTQIHQTYETEDGLMGMKEQEFVPVPGKSNTVFKPGRLHIMIIKPERNLVEGDSISFTLNFSSQNTIEVVLPVKASN